MPKKHRNNQPKPSPIPKDTAHAIIAIFSLVLSVFLLLGAFDAAGRVGNLTFEILTYFSGVGYYLFPIIFFLLSISLIHERESGLALPQILGSLLLLISSLGFVGLISERGGIIGSLISNPLVSLFDIYISMVILLSLGIISFIIIFDIPLKFDLTKLFKKIFSSELKSEKMGTDDAVTKALDKIEAEHIENPKKQEIRLSRDDEESFAPLIRPRRGRAWVPPPLSLLERDSGKPGVGDIKANANLIKRTFLNFGIMVEMDEISIGPSVTRYALKPAEGVKLSRILGLQNNLELALAAHPVRIEAPIPGKSLVGIEVPNSVKSIIGLGSLIAETSFAESEKPLFVALGRDITGASVFDNIANMQHLLIAGATG